VLVLDAGDSLLRDRSPALTSQGKSSVEVMNAMGYDAMALGAGDLSLLGVDGIRQRMQEARFAFLSANVVLPESGQLLAEPYIIRKVQGRRVAIIGLTDQVSLAEAEIRDPLSSLREVLAALEGQADILVLLSHVGLETNQRIAQEVPDIHLIVSGGGRGYTPEVLHQEVDAPLVHVDTASPGHAGRRVGVGLWWFDDEHELVAVEWAGIALEPTIPDDPAIARWIAANP
jgi:2',3'-cyclic-nucleotide 2'-phosphodiesterase (5'-nucleotidase family)